MTGRRSRGRPVLGAIAGFLFGLFLAADLWLFGIVASDSVLLTLLPFLGLALGLAVGLTGPLRRSAAAPPAAPSADPATDTGTV